MRIGVILKLALLNISLKPSFVHEQNTKENRKESTITVVLNESKCVLHSNYLHFLERTLINIDNNISYLGI